MAGGEGFSKTEKNRMLLSANQTTGMSAVHAHVHVFVCYICISMLIFTLLMQPNCSMN